MSEDVIEFSSLEPLKDNIKPTRRGRTAKELASIIQLSNSTPEENKSTIAEQDAEYREAIEGDTSDDPLAAWVDYLNFIQTAYYNVSPTIKLLPALEKCLNAFLNEAKYHDDLRYVKLWCLLCESVDDCLRPYRLMLFKGIGTKRAVFYLDYSKALYLRRHFSAAEDILKKGIANGAQPKDHLQNRLEYLQRLKIQRDEKEARDGREAASDLQYDFDVPVSSRRLQVVDLLTGEVRDNSGSSHDSISVRSISQPIGSGSTRSQSVANPVKRLGKVKQQQQSSASFAIYQDDDGDDDNSENQQSASTQLKPSGDVVRRNKPQAPPSTVVPASTSSSKNIKWDSMESYHNRRKENVQPFTGNLTKAHPTRLDSTHAATPTSHESYEYAHIDSSSSLPSTSSSSSRAMGSHHHHHHRHHPHHGSIAVLPSTSSSSGHPPGEAPAPSFNSRVFGQSTMSNKTQAAPTSFEIWQDE